MRALTSLVLGACLVPACARLRPYPSYVDGGYKGKAFENEILAALPVPPEQVNVARHAEPDGDDGFRGFVAGELGRAVSLSLARRLRQPKPVPAAAERARDQRVRAGGCEAGVPPRDLVKSDGPPARFALVLDTVKLEKRLPDPDARAGYEWQTGAANPSEGRPNFAPKEGLGVGSDEAPAVAASAHYLVYDYADGKVIACGQATGLAPLKGAADRGTWTAAITDLANHVPLPF